MPVAWGGGPRGQERIVMAVEVFPRMRRAMSEMMFRGLPVMGGEASAPVPEGGRPGMMHRGLAVPESSLTGTGPAPQALAASMSETADTQPLLLVRRESDSQTAPLTGGREPGL